MPAPRDATQTRNIALDLKGDLPCVRCGYQLRGLSVTAACPECGTAVKATLLKAIDPKAHLLAPLRAPTLVYAGLLAWIGGTAAAAALTAALLFTTLLIRRGVIPKPKPGELRLAELAPWAPAAATTAAAAAAIAALGAWGLAIAHPGARRINASAAAGAAALAAAAALFAALILQRPALGLQPPADALALLSDQHKAANWRIAVGTTLAIAFALLRPSGRRLTQRSKLIRNRRKDHQPMAATAAALAVAVLADTAQRLLPEQQLSVTLSTASVLLGAITTLGWTLATLTIFTLAYDAWILRPAILGPQRSLQSVFEEPPTSPPHSQKQPPAKPRQSTPDQHA